MNIILVSDSLAKSRIVTISQSQIIMAVCGFISAGFMFALGTYWVTMKYAVDIQNPFIQSLISTLTQQKTQAAEKEMREQLNSLAVKLGELQARLMRLDAFGERLGRAAGVKPEEFRFSETRVWAARHHPRDCLKSFLSRTSRAGSRTFRAPLTTAATSSACSIRSSWRVGLQPRRSRQPCR